MKNTPLMIQDALIQTMKNQEIHTIKVTQITQMLKMSRSTFYLHYTSVFDVLQVIEDSLIQKIDRQSKLFWSYPPNVLYLSNPHPIILATMAIIKDNMEVAQVLWGPHGDPSFKIKCQRLIRNAFFPKHLFETSKYEDSLYEVAFMTGGHLELVNRWIENGCIYDMEKLTLLIYKMMYPTFHA